ncbi:MAG: OsmC family protein [Planctomycetota bacterium]|jgi:putative redox protein|nr:osmotically inducible protein OsmC [Planctomycetota bacterium]MDP6368936.1 OsmC family protein [Planctomycetota bacterium]MDP6519364.1 OsmC family protein [Planctomycetota bacterium]MDP6838026.1 OsmC family protein [Planctomycetota bacterium]
MVAIEITYTGGLHTEAVHGPSGARLETDAPLDNAGRGEAFSPTDLAAAALGSCMVTIMGIVAERHGWDISATRVKVEKEMVAEPVRRIGRLAVTINVAGDHDERARTALERAAHNCPVHASLHPETVVDLKLLWAGTLSTGS